METSQKKLISVIIPVYNEADNIPLVYRQVKDILDNLAERYRHELIFINDGSRDASGKCLAELESADPAVRALEFSRNFGKEAALSAGLHQASGAAAVMLDADLQHPPELIPEFLRQWEDGAEVVIGLRTKNPGGSWSKKLSAKIYYRIMNRIADTKIRPGATDFRLLDRQVIDAFNLFSERDRMARGLVDWLGFRHVYVKFEANGRANGRASYSAVKLIRLALGSFVAHSLFPLKLAGYLGIIITFISGLLGITVAANKYLLGDPWRLNVSYATSLIILNLFLVGIVLSALGIIALYIGMIRNEVSGRPLYVLRQKK